MARNMRWLAVAASIVGIVSLVPPATAGQPECRVELQSAKKRAYNSNMQADPLGAAIAEAAPGDTLQVIGACRGNFVVTKSLTLRGRPGKSDALDGGGAGTVLAIRGGTSSADTITVNVDDLLITNGDRGISRAALSSAEAAWSDVTLTDASVSGNRGFGIEDVAFSADASARGTVTLTRSLVRGNGSGIGTGIFGTYAIDFSTISENGGPGITIRNGGLLNAAVDVSLTSSTVSGNGAGISLGRTFGALAIAQSLVTGNAGVGVFYGGRGSGAATMDHSTISGNHGGGIATSAGESSTLTVTDSTVSGNRTSGSGAGVNVALVATVTLVRTSVTGNVAAGDGGGIASDWRVTLVDSVVSGNSAGGNGGGIVNRRSALTLTGTTVTGNTAAIAGGGIFNEAGATVTADSASALCGNTPDDWPGCSS